MNPAPNLIYYGRRSSRYEQGQSARSRSEIGGKAQVRRFDRSQKKRKAEKRRVNKNSELVIIVFGVIRRNPENHQNNNIIIQPWGTGARRQRASQYKNDLIQSPVKRNKGSFISNFELEQAGRRPPATWTITTSTAATATATTTTRGGGEIHPRTHTTNRGLYEFGKKEWGKCGF